MATKKNDIFQLKISLQGISPLIWRRILIPANATFEELNLAVQRAMGWDGYHLHMFEIENPATCEMVAIGNPEDSGMDGAPALPENKKKLSDFFSLTNTKALYTYDFGDDWEHKIVLEKVIEVDPDLTYPVCIAGKRACPPEDCGGIDGYQELLEILADPKHPEYEEKSEWVDPDFDPEVFEAEECLLN